VDDPAIKDGDDANAGTGPDLKTGTSAEIGPGIGTEIGAGVEAGTGAIGSGENGVVMGIYATASAPRRRTVSSRERSDRRGNGGDRKLRPGP
jgi:hypothetical protein